MKKLSAAFLCGVIAVLAVSCNKEKDVPVTSVSLSQPTAEMIIGETVQLSATVLPSDATDKSVTWASSKQSVATVSGSGKVTAVAEGVSTITASAGGKSASCTVTVSKGYVAVTSVTLNKTELAMEKGQTETLTATINPTDATEQTVTWSSSETAVATVDASGKITAVAGGSAVITAKAGDKQATCTVTVTVPVESVTLDRESITLEEEATTTLVATVKPDDATDKTVSWSSSNNEIAMVDDTGKVMAIKEGEATISAKAGEKTATCNVTVNKKFIAVTSVTLNKAELALEKGQNETLVATVAPEDATDKNVVWKSSDENVATVDNAGKVTAIAGGNAIITARAGEKEATCAVAVTVPVTSVSLDQNSLTLEEEQTATLTATVLPEDATDKTVTWSSSNDAVAKVENGVVTAIKEGTATITAKAGDKEAKCEVTVKKNPQNEPIQFADANVKARLVAAFDKNNDGELSYGEAASVTSIEGVFGNKTDYTSFDEFEYFTGVTMIPRRLFQNWKLKSIKLPPSLQSIGSSAFSNTQLSTISIPDSVTDIGSSCFFNCQSLTKVTLPASLSKIDEEVFIQCYSLNEITLPTSLSEIDNCAFRYCSNLDNISIPHSINIIGAGAFADCSALKEIIIPEQVKTIGSSAFERCISMQRIVVTSKEPPMGGQGMFSVTNNCPIIVPDYERFVHVQYWKDYFWRIQQTGEGPREIEYPTPSSVDLGLPSGLKWASCNLGAESPEELGYYYSWGDIDLKDAFAWTYYKWGLDSSSDPNWLIPKVTKYCYQASYGWNGFVDNVYVLLPEDDAAHMHLGDKWRMPTYDEFSELINYCSWEWSSYNNIQGYKVTSRKNGNSIFLPSSGYKDYTSGYYDSQYGYYWTSTISNDFPTLGLALFFNSSSVLFKNLGRPNGLVIRPVYK